MVVRLPERAAVERLMQQGPHRTPHELDCLIAGEIGGVSQPDH